MISTSMPKHTARKVDAVVVEPTTTTPRPDHCDAYESIAEDASIVGESLRSNDPSRTITTDPDGRSTSDSNKDEGRSSEEESSHASDCGKRTKDDPLHTNSNGATARYSLETSIWDWDAPLDAVGDLGSYHYEPTGDLLNERRQRRSSRVEFTIPHPINPAGTTWSLNSLPSTTRDSTFSTSIQRANSGSLQGNKRKPTIDTSTNSQQPSRKRTSKSMADVGDPTTSPSDARSSPQTTRSQASATPRPQPEQDENDNDTRNPADSEAAPSNPTPAVEPGRSLTDPIAAPGLPPRRVFLIQIGEKLFRLSGASISSDEQLRQNNGADGRRTLYIDRDPTTFDDIALHLQGYHVLPKDANHFVKLFADAQYFSLPKLTAQLFASPIFIRIGNEEFQIPRDVFSNPGDTPNYFSLGFAVFFSTPNAAFPHVPQRSYLRPPTLIPPNIPNRSAKTFADILQLLKGYPIEIRSREHQSELLRDARYFHLKGLEQRLISHEISYNLARRKHEITIRLQDIRQSGVTFVADAAQQQTSEPTTSGSSGSTTSTGPGWVHYQRPYVDSEAYGLILEIEGEESTYLALPPSSSASSARIGHCKFFRQTLARISSLFSVIANKMNLPVTQPLGLMMLERGAGVASLPVNPVNTGVSDENVKVRIGPDADVVVNGKSWRLDDAESEDDREMDVDPAVSQGGQARSGESSNDGEQWILKRAQWRIRVQPVASSAAGQTGKGAMEVILAAVKIDAFSNERERNSQKGFLM